MPIVKWTRIDPTTERHLPTGVEIVKVPAKTADNPTSRIKWVVCHPQRSGGTYPSWTKATRTDAKRIAETHNIPGVYAKRDEAHADAIGEGVVRDLAAAWQDPDTDAELRSSIRHLREVAHAEALDEAEAREAQSQADRGERVSLRVQSTTETRQVAVVAPQLSPEDTPKWDPKRKFANVAPATDRQVHMAGSAYVIGDSLVAPILARLRRAELELAAARAELIRRDAEAVLHVARGGDWGLPRADGSYATSGLPYPTR